MPTGPFPTGIWSTLRPTVGAIRETVPGRPFATHTTPPPATTAVGPSSTGIDCSCSVFVPGSTRETVPSSLLTTQNAPDPNVTAPGRARTWISPTSLADCGSTAAIEFHAGRCTTA